MGGGMTEVDALIASFVPPEHGVTYGSDTSKLALELARKLERQRDELLEALRSIHDNTDGARETARAAIAAVEGK
jgi:hypothetical protein